MKEAKRVYQQSGRKVDLQQAFSLSLLGKVQREVWDRIDTQVRQAAVSARREIRR